MYVHAMRSQEAAACSVTHELLKQQSGHSIVSTCLSACLVYCSLQSTGTRMLPHVLEFRWQWTCARERTWRDGRWRNINKPEGERELQGVVLYPGTFVAPFNHFFPEEELPLKWNLCICGFLFLLVFWGVFWLLLLFFCFFFCLFCFVLFFCFVYSMTVLDILKMSFAEYENYQPHCNNPK